MTRQSVPWIVQIMATIFVSLFTINILYAQQKTPHLVQDSTGFIGRYHMIDEEGEILDKIVEIYIEDGNYFFQLDEDNILKATLAKDGRSLIMSSDESTQINDDGSVEVDLGADILIFFEDETLVYEVSVQDLGTMRFILKKI